MSKNQKERLDNIYKSYADVENDMRCLLQTLEVYEDHYCEEEMDEVADTINIIRKVVKSSQQELRENNDRLDKVILES